MHDVQHAGETPHADVSARWDGDPRHFSTQIWPEAGDVAAVVVARDGRAILWMNARHVAAGVAWLVREWAKCQTRHAPVAVVFADELPAWRLPPEGRRTDLGAPR